MLPRINNRILSLFGKTYCDRKQKIVVGMMMLSSLSSCCPDIIHEKNALYQALTRFELTTFIDSSGNHLQILLNEEGYERVSDSYNDCSVEGYAQFPRADFVILPPEGGSMSFRQRYSLLNVKDVGVSGFYGAEIDTTIQGHEYLNCWSKAWSDSLGEVSAIIIDKHYGLVMFSYRDQYRWERVLD